MTMPNFLIIGAAKAGTTSLYNYLKQHPQIYMSPVKEPKFFAFEEGEKPDFQGPGDIKANRFVVTDLESYSNLFEGHTYELAIGEASPAYLYCPKTAERIRKILPNTKLIVILRDPVERSYSSFLHLRRDGIEPLSDFAQALQAEEIRIKNNWGFIWHYMNMSLYYVQLQRYFENFNSNQIKVYLYEEFKNHTIRVLQDIFEFLEVDKQFIVDTSIKANVSGIPRNKLLHKLLNEPNFFKKKFLKPFIPFKMRQYLTYNLIQVNLEKPTLSLELRKDLIQLFQGDILKLQELINRDLSSWLR
jgi:hypothetical protein